MESRDRCSECTARASYQHPYLQNIAVLMNPALSRGQLPELRDFWLVFKLDDFWIVVVLFIQPFGNNLQAAGHSHQLSLQLIQERHT